MGYSATIELVVGDTLPVLTFTLRDRNTAASGQTLRPNDPLTWAPIDVTGADVSLYIRKTGASGPPSATLTCTVVGGPAGKVATDFPTGTLAEAGTFDGEIEIVFSGGAIMTVQDFIKLKVRDQIG